MSHSAAYFKPSTHGAVNAFKGSDEAGISPGCRRQSEHDEVGEAVKAFAIIEENAGERGAVGKGGFYTEGKFPIEVECAVLAAKAVLARVYPVVLPGHGILEARGCPQSVHSAGDGNGSKI